MNNYLAYICWLVLIFVYPQQQQHRNLGTKKKSRIRYYILMGLLLLDKKLFRLSFFFYFYVFFFLKECHFIYNNNTTVWHFQLKKSSRFSFVNTSFFIFLSLFFSSKLFPLENGAIAIAIHIS